MAVHRMNRTGLRQEAEIEKVKNSHESDENAGSYAGIFIFYILKNRVCFPQNFNRLCIGN